MYVVEPVNKLPEKFSAAIRVAVEDMKKCEADHKYVIDMNDWHCPENDGCHVCMAGAVMAQTFNVPVGALVLSNDQVENIREILFAFDDLRTEDYDIAFHRFSGRPFNWELFELPPYYPYEDDKDKFYNWCLAVADAFENVGE